MVAVLQCTQVTAESMTVPNTQIQSTSTSRREERTSSSSRSISSTTPMLPLTTGRLPLATASTWLIPIPAAHNGTSPRTHTVGLVLRSDAVKTWVNKTKTKSFKTKTLRPKTKTLNLSPETYWELHHWFSLSAVDRLSWGLLTSCWAALPRHKDWSCPRLKCDFSSRWSNSGQMVDPSEEFFLIIGRLAYLSADFQPVIIFF